jgi:SAM-dependent methyltransferase
MSDKERKWRTDGKGHPPASIDLEALNDATYYHACEYNYRVAYAAGDSFYMEDRDWKSTIDEVCALLAHSGKRPEGTRLLDVGCGDGTITLSLARRGYTCTGIDVASAAISRARERAAEAGVNVRFLQADALRLAEVLHERFDVVLDVKSYHMLILDSHRQEYLLQLHRRLSDDGYLVFLNACDDSAAGERIVSFDEYYRARSGLAGGVPYKPWWRWALRLTRPRRLCLMCRQVSRSQYASELQAAGFAVDYEYAPRTAAGFVARRASPSPTCFGTTEP